MAMFDQSSANPEQQNQEVEAVKLEDIVGDGKKYATNEDLAKAYGSADAFIAKLTAENAEMRVKVEAKIQAEDFLKNLTTNQDPATTTNTTTTQDPDNSGNAEVDIDKLLDEKLKLRDSVKTASANQDKVTAALQLKFGNRAGEMFKAKAQELGADLEQLAMQAPDLVLQSFGITGATPVASAATPQGDVRTATTDGIIAEAGTKAHLQQLRKAGKLSRNEYYAECQKAISVDSKKFNS